MRKAKKKFRLPLLTAFGLSLLSCSSVPSLEIEEAKDILSSYGDITHATYSYESEIVALGEEADTSMGNDLPFVSPSKVVASALDEKGERHEVVSYMGREGLENASLTELRNQAVLFSRSRYLRLPLRIKAESFYVLGEDGKLLDTDCAYGLLKNKFIDSTSLSRLAIEKTEEGGLLFHVENSEKYTIFNNAYGADIIAVARFDFKALYDKNGYLVEESAVTSNYKGVDTARTVRAKTTFTYA